MSRLNERDIARDLTESERFEPPAGLLEKIKAEIPQEVRVGTAVPGTVSIHNTPAAGGGPNLWIDPNAALAGFREALPGETGSRNTLRGDGFFNIDTALSKRFTMPWSEKQNLQFRWESYNLTNTVMMDPISASVSLTGTSSFGRLSAQLGSARQMEFALRFNF